MALSSGSVVGPYEILAPLGAGGMGEVYLARDPRLNRRIAIKILPTANAERQQRFEQEALAASLLNHPNIITIYEIGDAEWGRFIAMELVEGRTLRALMAEGLPFARLAPLGAQMARALAIEPTLLLLDEPLSALDAKIRVALRHEIREIQRSLGITTVYVTHDQEEALELSDRIVVMSEGRMEQERAVGELLGAGPELTVSGKRMTLRTAAHSAELERTR